ncbi:hypothetical protein PIB30_002687 [Stylosanthes scabra]|uniref:Uncharacterized protein n=1 Tax=Stylosanthes scabra TaxID=79078 RepID=A0ABU6R231_9FABA|nr:hypothetical protein [Stylosanthes scabra]
MAPLSLDSTKPHTANQTHAHTGHRPPPPRRPFLILLPLASSAPEVHSHPLTPLRLASPCIVRFVVVASPSHRRLLALLSSRVHRSGSLSHKAYLSSPFCRSHSHQPTSNRRSSASHKSQPTSPSRSAVLAAHVTSLPSSALSMPVVATCKFITNSIFL